MYADIVVLKKTGPDPYQSLLHSSASDVRLVMIGGAPIYGDPALMRQLLPGGALEDVTVCGDQKLLSMDTYVAGNGSTKVWETTTSKLSKALSQWGTSLAPLAECSERLVHAQGTSE